MSFRVGHGYDVHRFEDGRPLWLGGVHIKDHSGLAGHSDADVLLHAIIDAILGAASLPDIGTIFLTAPLNLKIYQAPYFFRARLPLSAALGIKL